MATKEEWQEFLWLTSDNSWENDPIKKARLEELRPKFWGERKEAVRYLVFPPHGKPKVIKTLKAVAELVKVNPQKLKRVITNPAYIGTYCGFGIEIIEE
ncbi:hypothetical protein NHG29_01375 [Aerococcaceae bacterium NML160702]|nr:hypothetical protein [Aerococcaceae bacterium NML190073]MCW6681517.1 hypothetical protein [Aerococcaceae bacterium NML160702]